MNITELIIKDVRCFAGEQTFNIRPITLLVGENSTGKSTMLACLQILHNAASIRGRGLNFNDEPYLMGAFSDIVRRTKPKNKEFKIGIGVEDEEKETTKYVLTLVEKDKGAEPIIRQIQILFQDGSEVVIETKNKDRSNRNGDKTGIKSRKQAKLFVAANTEVKSHKKGKKLVVTADEELVNHPALLFIVKDKIESSLPEEKSMAHKFARFTSNFRRLDIDSFAPIRSKPKRTHDPLKEEWGPEGNEMPMVLNSISRSKQWEEEWNQLKEELMKFGKSSGLYKEISIRKKLGQSKSDPFQLLVKVRGSKVNLIDVGYGVNQILPILARICLWKHETTFLIQQPEVHLHPRAQAAFSSLLIDIHKRMKHRFIIETHSDYIIDRARIEIKRGNIQPEDLSLIYLEPIGNKVKAHNIEFDKASNMSNVPESYREFFQQESDDFLGF